MKAESLEKDQMAEDNGHTVSPPIATGLSKRKDFRVVGLV